MSTPKKALLSKTLNRKTDKWKKIGNIDQLSKLTLVSEMLKDSHKKLLKCHSADKKSLEYDDFFSFLNFVF